MSVCFPCNNLKLYEIFSSDKDHLKNKIQKGFLNGKGVTNLIEESIRNDKSISFIKNEGWFVGDNKINLSHKNSFFPFFLRRIFHYVCLRFNNSYKNQFESATNRIADLYLKAKAQDEKSPIADSPIVKNVSDIDVEKIRAQKEKQIVECLSEFRTNAEKHVMGQLKEFKAKNRAPFPTDGVISIANVPYTLYPNRICHAIGLSSIEYLKDIHVIFEEPNYSYRMDSKLDQEIDKIINKINSPFTVSRILLDYGKNTFDHEFIIVRMESSTILLQADVTQNLTIADERGWMELTSQDVENLFYNDPVTLKRLFNQEWPGKIIALDHYLVKPTYAEG